MDETIQVTCYRIEYKNRMSKAKKQSFVLAKTKKSAMDEVYSSEGFPIGIKAEAWKEETINSRLLLPHILKTEFI